MKSRRRVAVRQAPSGGRVGSTVRPSATSVSIPANPAGIGSSAVTPAGTGICASTQPWPAAVTLTPSSFSAPSIMLDAPSSLS